MGTSSCGSFVCAEFPTNSDTAMVPNGDTFATEGCHSHSWSVLVPSGGKPTGLRALWIVRAIQPLRYTLCHSKLLISYGTFMSLEHQREGVATPIERYRAINVVTVGISEELRFDDLLGKAPFV